MLNRREIDQFREDGFLLLRDFYDRAADLDPIVEAIHHLISIVARKHQVSIAQPPFEPANFDEGFMHLIHADRKYGGEVYDAIKHIPQFKRLVADRRHEELFRKIRPNASPGIATGGAGIRIDVPNEDDFRANWHQEYPAQLRSIDGVVFWSPLVPVEATLGPVQLCIGSHRDGPVPVHTHDPDSPHRKGAYSLKLKDETERLKRYSKLAPTTDPGDLLIMDFLLLHASGINRGPRPRWTMQFRYFNFDDPVGQRHAWSGSFAAGVDFRSVHPELCADDTAS